MTEAYQVSEQSSPNFWDFNLSSQRLKSLAVQNDAKHSFILCLLLSLYETNGILNMSFVSGTGFGFSLCAPKQSPILSDEWLPRERRDKVFSVPFVPGVSSRWFFTTWFSHQTVFHVIPSSLWADSLYSHKVLTVSPGKATIYLGLSVVFSWMKIKGAKT